jgi:hypothetical protein
VCVDVYVCMSACGTVSVLCARRFLLRRRVSVHKAKQEHKQPHTTPIQNSTVFVSTKQEQEHKPPHHNPNTEVNTQPNLVVLVVEWELTRGHLVDDDT